MKRTFPQSKQCLKKIKQDHPKETVAKKQTIPQKKNKCNDLPKKKINFSKENTSEKPDWNKIKSEKKQIRIKRRVKQNSLYSVCNEAKKKWEKLRRSDCKSDEKEKLTEELLALLKENMMMDARSHDMTRIVQWLLKLGSPDIRKRVSKELLNNIVQMAGFKYTNHTIKDLLKYGPPDVKKLVIDKFSGHVIKLLNNKISFKILEDVYSKLASSEERFKLRRELYGNVLVGGLDKTDSVFSALNDKADLKLAAINKTEANLSKLMDKKYCLSSSLVHTVLYDYVSHCNPSQKAEIISKLKSFMNELMTSKDGVKVASLVIQESSNKEKKSLVKDFKSDIMNIANGEFSSFILMTLFDSVDDTVLMKKALLPGLLMNVEDIVNNDHGRKVILYLTAHRDPSYFHPADIEWFKQADSSSFIKKESSLRLQELQEAFVEPLLKKIFSNIEFWLSNAKVGMVTLAVLKASNGELLKNAYDVIASFITNINNTISVNSANKVNIIEHAGIHMILKKLIQRDLTYEVPENTFSKALLERLNDDVLYHWIQCTKGCFLLVFIFELKISEITSALNAVLSKKIRKSIMNQSNKGAEVLKKFL